MEKAVSYLRVVLTEACPLSCPYCHEEGGFSGGSGGTRGLSPKDLLRAVSACVGAGVRKVKFLGGEPFLYRGLHEVVSALRRRHPVLDISAISSGVVRRSVLDRCIQAGLTRCNVSVHGWRPGDFAIRGGTARMHRRRAAFLGRLMELGALLKVNYVYTGRMVEEDLAELLEWAADKPLVVGLLDDLSNAELGPQVLEQVLAGLRGTPERRLIDEDPHSLSTTHLLWSDGLRVEIKDQHLGDVAPWRACDRCPKRGICREGVFAVRLSPTGRLQLCMDRPDLSIDVRSLPGSDVATLGEAITRHFQKEAA